MDRHQFVKILDGLFNLRFKIKKKLEFCSQLLSYGRRIPLHELDARIDVNI